MEHTIHGSTVFIKGNNIISQYKVEGSEVSKVVDEDGDEFFESFYTFGDLPLNIESILLAQLRAEKKI